MSECGQAYPEYIANCERIKPGKSHGAQTIGGKYTSHNKTVLPKTQYKRVGLACHVWAPDGENTYSQIMAKANRTTYTR